MTVIPEGLKFRVDVAKVGEVMSFQDDDGKPLNIVPIECWGGTNNIMVSSEEARDYRQMKGKVVSVEGDLHVARKSNGQVSCKMTNIKTTPAK